jgi:predicted deacetylase
MNLKILPVYDASNDTWIVFDENGQQLTVSTKEYTKLYLSKIIKPRYGWSSD